MNTTQPAPTFISTERKIVILPIGSCEQHGPHLPVETDLRIAQLLAEELATVLGDNEAILLPPVPFSCSWEHKGVGTIVLNVSTLANVVHDIAKSLKTWDIPMVLILVNWHGGNDLLGALATEITATEGIPSAVIPAISQIGKAWDESQITQAKEIHAGAVETSIVQAYWPELVAGMITDADHDEPAIKPAKAQAILQSLGIRTVTREGVWGAPEEADPVKGKALIGNLVMTMVEQTRKLIALIEEHDQEDV